MRLHRSGALGMRQPEDIAEPFARQPRQPRARQRRTDGAGGGGAEEAQRRVGGNPQPAGDLHPDDQCRQRRDAVDFGAVAG